MSVLSIDFWFIVYMLLVLGVVLSVFVITVMHFLTPKILIEKYFRSPYFRPAECEMFSGFPFAIMRTIMFMRVVGFPKSGEKRGLTNAYKLAPNWYINFSKIIVIIVVLTLISMLSISIGFFLHSLVNDA